MNWNNIPLLLAMTFGYNSFKGGRKPKQSQSKEDKQYKLSKAQEKRDRRKAKRLAIMESNNE